MSRHTKQKRGVPESPVLRHRVRTIAKTEPYKTPVGGQGMYQEPCLGC